MCRAAADSHYKRTHIHTREETIHNKTPTTSKKNIVQILVRELGLTTYIRRDIKALYTAQYRLVIIIKYTYGVCVQLGVLASRPTLTLYEYFIRIAY